MIQPESADKILKRVLIVAGFRPRADTGLGDGVGMRRATGLGIDEGRHGTKETLAGRRGNLLLLGPVIGNVKLVIGFGHGRKIKAISHTASGEEIPLAFGCLSVVGHRDFIRQLVGRGQGLGLLSDRNLLWVGKKGGGPGGDILLFTAFAGDEAALEVVVIPTSPRSGGLAGL
jgi:hypothetical protein